MDAWPGLPFPSLSTFRLSVGSVLAFMLVVSTAAGICPGDCDQNRQVTINELILGVNIALGNASPSACVGLDGNDNGTADVNELIAAVNHALGGCPGQAPTATRTATPSPTATPSATRTGTPECGNGVARRTEECDDGNRADGDGCTAECQLEPGGNACAGVPTRSGTALRTTLVASNLSRPLHVAAPKLDPNRLFIVEQPGRIRLVKNGQLLPEPFLDITSRVSCCGERGLLSVAFHPDFENNSRFFVDYTNLDGNTVIARYTVGGAPDVVDAASERILLTIPQPFANHNGGQLAFGPDGYLYAGMGDGGGGGDPQENGQKDTTPLGKLLRLDVNAANPPYYAVPPSNPNAGAGALLGLIWAKGLRNPWRFSFDRATGELYIADVGQGDFEEIDIQPASSAGGENYGWDIFEGSHCFEPAPLLPDCPLPPTGFTMPVLEYDHGQGCSVTGGFVYRGCTLPELRGTYFYADYCTNFIRSFVYAGGRATSERDWTADLAPEGGGSFGGVAGFGEDARGELYICDQVRGTVFKIVAAP